VTFNVDGSFEYTPNVNFNGFDSFTYGVRDRPAAPGTMYVVTRDPNSGAASELFTISPPSPVATHIATLNKTFKYTNPWGLQFLPDGRLFAVSDFNLVELNAASGAARIVDSGGTIPALDGFGLALSPVDGKLYGLGDDSLIVIDAATGGRTLASRLTQSDLQIASLAFSSDGTLYALDMNQLQPDRLVKINVATGAVTILGPTGTNGSRGIAAISFDAVSDTLYMALTQTQSELYTLNRLTGVATPIGVLRPPGAHPNVSLGWVSGLSMPPTGPQSIATVTVSVSAVNDSPIAVDDRYTLVGDRTLSVQAAQGLLANDSDPDGNVLVSTVITDPSHGTLVLNSSGGFVYTPAIGFYGSDSYTYRVSDGLLQSGVATVSLLIEPRAATGITAHLNGPVLSVAGTGLLDEIAIDQLAAR
jgi:hypothetical protein